LQQLDSIAAEGGGEEVGGWRKEMRIQYPISNRTISNVQGCCPGRFGETTLPIKTLADLALLARAGSRGLLQEAGGVAAEGGGEEVGGSGKGERIQYPISNRTIFNVQGSSPGRLGETHQPV